MIIEDPTLEFTRKIAEMRKSLKIELKNKEYTEIFISNLENEINFSNDFMKLFNYDLNFSFQSAKKMIQIIQHISFTSSGVDPLQVNREKRIISLELNSDSSVRTFLSNLKEAVKQLEEFEDNPDNVFLLNIANFTEGFICENYGEIILFFQYYFPNKIKTLFIKPPNLSTFGLLYKNILKTNMKKIVIITDSFNFEEIENADIINEFFSKRRASAPKRKFLIKEIRSTIREIKDEIPEDFDTMKFKSHQTIELDQKTQTTNFPGTLRDLNGNNNFVNLSITSHVNEYSLLKGNTNNSNNNNYLYKNLYLSNQNVTNFSYIASSSGNTSKRKIIFEKNVQDRGCSIDDCIIL